MLITTKPYYVQSISFNGITLLHTIDNVNAYGTAVADLFGFPVSTDGTTAIVGAYREDDATGDSSGKAYIFDVSTGNLLHTLDNPNVYGTGAYDNFGHSVAISDNYATVTAKFEDDGGTSSGTVYVFDVSTGNLVHTLDNPNAYSTVTNDQFGQSVDMSSTHIIVGAHQEDSPTYTAAGVAYIFDVSTGNLLHTLDNPDAYSANDTDRFGHSVAISDNYAIVGAREEDYATGISSGKAYIFDVSTGNLLHTLDNPNAYGTEQGDYFGDYVSISDNYAIVSATQEDSATAGSSGKVYIFDVSTGNLLHTIDNPEAYPTGAGDKFGYSISINGNIIMSGALLEDELDANNSGKAYLFQLN